MARMKGIDVSYFQGDIDFQKVAKSIDFVIIREGYRQVIDAKFLNYVKGFIEAGVPIHGIYHFIYGLTKEEVLAEARSCAQNITKAGLPKTCRVWADLEYDTIYKAKSKGVVYTPEMVNEHTVAFCEYMKSMGYPVGIYLNNDFYNNYYEKSVIEKYELWLADYTGQPDHECLYQQYSETGRIDGISENVDMNYYFGTDNIVGTATAAALTESISNKPSSIVENAITWMELLAKDNSHGYDQRYRWGERGDYDCSSAVISAWENAGVPVKSGGATYTGNMYEVFTRNGFKDVTDSVNLSNGMGLIRGDVLLNHANHTAMYCGNGFEVEASINEYGGVTGGAPGDQTGEEILVKNYRNYPWNAILRYADNNSGAVSSFASNVPTLKLGSTGEEVRNLQQKLIVLGYNLQISGEFGASTERKVRHFQKKYGLEVDGIVGKETLDKIDEIIGIPSSSASSTSCAGINNSCNKKKLLYRARVTADLLNVRLGPGLEYPKLVEFPQLCNGSIVNVYDTKYAASNGNPWLYISIANKYYGYVSGNYVEHV